MRLLTVAILGLCSLVIVCTEKIPMAARLAIIAAIAILTYSSPTLAL